MLKRSLFIISLLFCAHANATHWLTYYIYLETEYVQGPWSRMDILESSEYKYLAPKQYENLFGSVPEEMVNTMIANLRENKPEIYQWDFDSRVNGDTVFIVINEPVDHFETIKNEITATLTLNSFSVVQFQLPESTETLTLANVQLPFLDLVTQETILPEEEMAEVEIPHYDTEVDRPCEQRGLSILLYFSLGLNLLLIVILIYRKRK